MKFLIWFIAISIQLLNFPVAFSSLKIVLYVYKCLQLYTLSYNDQYFAQLFISNWNFQKINIIVEVLRIYQILHNIQSP
jgi:hypothetical protein